MLKKPVRLKRKDASSSKSSNSSPLVFQSGTFESFPPSLPYSCASASVSMPNFHVQSSPVGTHTKKVLLSSSILSQTHTSSQSSEFDQPAYKTESILTDTCTCSDCFHDMRDMRDGHHHLHGMRDMNGMSGMHPAQTTHLDDAHAMQYRMQNHSIHQPASTPVLRCASPTLEDHDEWIANTILTAVNTKDRDFQWDI